MERLLNTLAPGEKGTVTALHMPPGRADALLRLGLRPGAEIQLLRRSPLGDPAAYRFCGLTAALRAVDACCIRVQTEDGGEGAGA